MARYTAIFDACVFYPAQVRDLLIELARTDTFTAKWSDDIQTEWITSLRRDRPDISEARLAVTRTKMEEAVPDAVIRGYDELIERLTLPDPNDRHVLAAALVGRCDVIVTFNLSDFPRDLLAQFSIEAQSPHEFIANLFDLHPEIVDAVARKIQRRLIKPPVSLAGYLTALVERQLAVTSGLLRERWGTEVINSAAEVIQIDDRRRQRE